MKKIQSCTLIIVILCVLLFSFTSCSNKKNDDNQKLKYYCNEENADVLLDIIEKYNKACLKNYDESYQIEIVKFNTEEEMLTKLSTEIMADKGPDIFSLAQKLPFEKLAENVTFANIDEIIENGDMDNKINFDEYNDLVMNAGVVDGKRYFVPLFYCPDIAITSEEILKKYNISDDFDYTYDCLDAELSYYFEKYSDIPFCGSGYGEFFFYQYIDSYVDYFKKKSYLDTEEFKSNLDIVTEISKNNEVSYNDYVVLTSKQTFVGGSINSIVRNLCSDIFADSHPLILNNSRVDKDSTVAYVQCAVAINDNSGNKDKALAFIKYALSESVQEYWSGALGGTGSSFVGTNYFALPVNNNALKFALNAACHTENYMDTKDRDITDLANRVVDDYSKIINNINVCSIFNYDNIKNTYYNSVVIGDIVDKYLNGDISKDKFIRQLTAATEIYLTE